MADTQDKPKTRAVRYFDAVDVNTLPLFRSTLNQLATDPGVDASTFQFVTPYAGAIRIVFQRIRQESLT